MELGNGYLLRMDNKLLRFTQFSPLGVSLTQVMSVCCHLISYAQPTLQGIYVTLAPVARSLQPLSKPSGKENGEDKGAGRSAQGVLVGYGFCF